MDEVADGSALVTGGGSGIGRATALALARRGAPVAVVDLRPEAAEAVAAEIRAAGGRAAAFAADVGRWEEVDRAVGAAVDALGPLGILVTAAGVFDDYRLAEDTSPELWRRTIDIDLSGTFYCFKRALAEMAPAGRGRLIAIASAAGLVGDGGGVAYVAAKHGVVGLVRRVAVTYAGRGITANAICPGPVETDLHARSVEMLATALAAQRRADRPEEGRTTEPPARRPAQPSEIAAAACYLASKEAAYVNGLALAIDGGWTAG